MTSSSLPLGGVRVLDLSRLLPGPYATLVLAKLGAQVDKLEDPHGGDYLRQMVPLAGEESALFKALNRNKRSLTLDLKSDVGRAAFLRLVESYDIVVESFRPGVMAKLGLGYQALTAKNPRLIYCAISGYGQTGPDALRAGHDLNYLARAGFLGTCGPSEATLPLLGGQVADVGGGSLFALVSILAALYERGRTGKGCFLDVSMTEGALAFSHMHLGALLQLPGTPVPGRGQGPLTGGYASYGVYRCSDGKFLAVGALEPKFFARLCARLERSDLLEKAYDLTDGGAAWAKAELATVFATRPRDAWVQLFAEDDVCVEPVWEGTEVLEDRQHQARQMFLNGEVRVPVPFSTPPVRPAPALGEHTREILTEAGLTEGELQPLLPLRR
jgi:alpha-methylacyl-CoA racemase